MKEKNVAIIGAGITGLTAAFYLKKQGVPFTVFEKSSHIGGVIRTRQKDGFVWETGPNTGVIGKPEVTELFEDLEALSLLETAPSLAGKRYIWKGHKLHAIPGDPLHGLVTPLFSFRDKFGLLLEPFRKKGTDPHENLSSFVRRRLGNSILNYAVDPFISGVYAGDPDILIPKYALPKLYNLEQNYGSFLGGAIRLMRKPKTDRDRKATKKTFSTQGGLNALVGRLTDAIDPEKFILECTDLRVALENDEYKIISSREEYGPFDKVITTFGANHIFETLPFLAGKGFDDAGIVRYAKVAQVAVGFKEWKGMPLDGFGALIPSREKRDILGVLFMSSLFRNRAPAGGAMLATFVGGLRHPEFVSLDDASLLAIVKRELTEILHIPDFSPDILEINRHEFAIPQYDLATPGRIAAYDAIERNFPGLLLGGNGIGGIGMADRIKQGRDLAERAL